MDELTQTVSSALAAIAAAASLAELDEQRVRYLGKKGELTQHLKQLGQLDPDARRARGAEVPESFYVDPLMYQAVSAGFYGPRDPVRVPSEDYGIDLEAEVVPLVTCIAVCTVTAAPGARVPRFQVTSS